VKGPITILITRRARSQDLIVLGSVKNLARERLPLFTMKPTKQRLDALHRHFLLPPPVPLYHYTSLEVLERITAKGEIWATDVNFLNDKTEYINARKFIENTLEERLTKKRQAHEAVESHFQKIDKRSRKR
jgi:hypothetical protein